MKEKMLEKLMELTEALMAANEAKKEMETKMTIMATITEKALESKYPDQGWKVLAEMLNVPIPAEKKE